MDGSLVDSMWIWPEVDRIYMGKYGLEQPADFHKAIEGKSYTETGTVLCRYLPHSASYRGSGKRRVERDDHGALFH